MSVDLVARVISSEIPAGPKMVLIILSDSSNGYGDSCYPSVPLIADLCSSSINSVRRHLQWLIEQRLIFRAHARGQATTYRINLQRVEEVWVDFRAKHRAAYERARRLAFDQFTGDESENNQGSDTTFMPQNEAKLSTTPPKFTPLPNLHPSQIGTPPKFEGATANPDEIDVLEISPLPNWDPSQIGTPPKLVSNPSQIGDYNESLTNISSSTIDEKVIHNSKNPRLDEIKGLLVELEKGRGKVLKVSPTGLIKIAHWISANIPNEIIRSAHQIASAQRQKSNDPTPISIGYLDSILTTLLMGLNGSAASSVPTSATTQTSGGKPWYLNNEEIEKKALSMGVNLLSTETWDDFRVRVLTYAKVDPEQYRRDLLNFKESTGAQESGAPGRHNERLSAKGVL